METNDIIKIWKDEVPLYSNYTYALNDDEDSLTTEPDEESNNFQDVMSKKCSQPIKKPFTYTTMESLEDPPIYGAKGKTTPGIYFFFLFLLFTTMLVTYFAHKTYVTSRKRANDQRIRFAELRRIDDGTKAEKIDHCDDTYRNPKIYPENQCQALNYLSRDGSIYMESSDGVSYKVRIKGVNWSGMETKDGVPHGLWDNFKNGTTVYEIADFLARNNFNSVRLPLCVQSILRNVKPRTSLINRYTHRAINIDSYFGLIKGIVKALGQRQLSVLLDLHTLTTSDIGEYWYSDVISKESVLEAVDLLSEELCSDNYWNIIGIDLKNEPWKCTWGDGNEDTDFRIGATTIGNRMLQGCPNWLAFVQGNNAVREIEIDGEVTSYYDWWGGGLQDAGENPVELSIANKVVWSPHYYSPSVRPVNYLYRDGVESGSTLKDFVELDNSTLRRRVKGTMNHMFGYLSEKSDAAIVLGEFGGLYTTDKHPRKTSQRVIDMIIENILHNHTYAGGYLWSLNPENSYSYNPVDTLGYFEEGLLKTDWLRANKKYLHAMSRMDSMEDLHLFPCIAMR